MKKSLLPVLFFLLSSCGYTTSSSIDENSNPSDQYLYFVAKYCSAKQVEILLSVGREELLPEKISMDGVDYFRCQKKPKEVWYRKEQISNGG